MGTPCRWPGPVVPPPVHPLQMHEDGANEVTHCETVAEHWPPGRSFRLATDLNEPYGVCDTKGALAALADCSTDDDSPADTGTSLSRSPSEASIASFRTILSVATNPAVNSNPEGMEPTFPVLRYLV